MLMQNFGGTKKSIMVNLKNGPNGSDGIVLQHGFLKTVPDELFSNSQL